MKARWQGFQSPLAESLTRFLAYKRAGPRALRDHAGTP